MSKAKYPKSAAEWQEAVDLAAACRAIHDCKLYGLLEGPEIDVDRCDYLLAEGKRKGVSPSAPVSELAARFAASYNSSLEAKEKTDANQNA